MSDTRGLSDLVERHSIGVAVKDEPLRQGMWFRTSHADPSGQSRTSCQGAQVIVKGWLVKYLRAELHAHRQMGLTRYAPSWGFFAANNKIAIKGSVKVSLPKFIEDNMERLLAEWQSFAQTCMPAAADMDELALRNGAKGMLEAVARDMKSSQSAAGQHEKSRGLKKGERSSPLGRTAQGHAAERLAAGFTIDQLVSEYRALRASVIRLWLSSPESPTWETMQELTRFNEAMDQSLTEAVRWFNNRLERSRTVFLGILGHDLRNPLGTLLAAVETTQITDDPKIIQDCIGRVHRSGNRMSEMIDVLLDFTRTHFGQKIPITLTPADLTDVCSEVTSDFKVSHPDSKITVECRGKLTGLWDEGRVHQGLSNLIKNAIEHGKRDGTITVTCTGNTHEVLLSVHNEGRPISRAKQRKIFEPFRRPAAEDDDDTHYRDSNHVGLGLYVVNQIAVAHGGSVEIDSNVQAGTRVTMRLPREQAAV